MWSFTDRGAEHEPFHAAPTVILRDALPIASEDERQFTAAL
jgi:hypothetical protein